MRPLKLLFTLAFLIVFFSLTNAFQKISEANLLLYFLAQSLFFAQIAVWSFAWGLENGLGLKAVKLGFLAYIGALLPGIGSDLTRAYLSSSSLGFRKGLLSSIRVKITYFMISTFFGTLVTLLLRKFRLALIFALFWLSLHVLLWALSSGKIRKLGRVRLRVKRVVVYTLLPAYFLEILTLLSLLNASNLEQHLGFVMIVQALSMVPLLPKGSVITELATVFLFSHENLSLFLLLWSLTRLWVPCALSYFLNLPQTYRVG